MLRRMITIIITGWLIMLPAQAQSPDEMLPIPQNLQREAAQAHSERKAFLLMF